MIQDKKASGNTLPRTMERQGHKGEINLKQAFLRGVYDGRLYGDGYWFHSLSSAKSAFIDYCNRRKQ